MTEQIPITRKPNLRICPFCMGKFKPTRSDQRYCTTNHRVQFWQHKRIVQAVKIVEGKLDDLVFSDRAIASFEEDNLSPEMILESIACSSIDEADMADLVATAQTNSQLVIKRAILQFVKRKIRKKLLENIRQEDEELEHQQQEGLLITVKA